MTDQPDEKVEDLDVPEEDAADVKGGLGIVFEKIDPGPVDGGDAAKRYNFTDAWPSK
jgi:hypothetical protein